jgi:NADPH:quinone reductase
VSFEFGPMILSGAAVRFFIVYELPGKARSRGIADLTQWLREDRIYHRVPGEYSLERIAEAHEAVERGLLSGNVVVTL